MRRVTPARCTGHREGNYPYDDLDRRRGAVEKLTHDHGGIGSHALMWRREQVNDGPWIAIAQVTVEHADELVNAVTAEDLRNELEGVPYEFSFSSRSRVWQVRKVKIWLPPLWTSCGCMACTYPGALGAGRCQCAELGCWCARLGHLSKSESK